MTSSTLCSVCTDLLVRPHEPLPEEPEQFLGVESKPIDIPSVEYSLPNITTSAEKGCPICVLLLQFLEEYRWAGTLEDPLPVRGILTKHRRGGDDGLCIMLSFDDSIGYGAQIYLQRKLPASRDRSEMTYKPETDFYKRKSVTVTPLWTVPAESSTMDDFCFETMRSWLDKCIQQHTLCHRNTIQPNGWLPSRLIDITGNNQARLVLTENMNEAIADTRYRYATLSHRWSQDCNPILLQTNITEYREGIDMSKLPQVFQDAITVSKKLGISYIWIDCLCILQDSKDDWENESSLMGQVYQNAFCNIGASKAADEMSNKGMGRIQALDMDKRSLGLFATRHAHHVFPTAVQVVRKDQITHEYFVYTNKMEGSLFGEQLLRRGWVFQERLLSPRSIYFGSQLTWECLERTASEAFPDGVPGWTFLNVFDRGMPVRIASILDENRFEHHAGELTKYRADVYTEWLKLVQEYSACELTYATDKFPALSGLVKFFGSILQDEYIAGLWRNDLLRGLLWYAQIRTPQFPVPRDYIAPSWSWASPLHSTCFAVTNKEPGYYFQKPICAINDVSVTLAGSNPMGKISWAQVTLTGHMRQSHRRSQDDVPANLYFPRDFGDYFDTRELQDNPPDRPQETFHFVITYHVHADWEKVVVGLILQPTTTEGQFRRIGVFVHPFGHEGDSVREFVNRPKYPRGADVFPEFAEFDPDNLDLHTVTII